MFAFFRSLKKFLCLGDDALEMGDSLPAITLNTVVESIAAGRHHTCALALDQKKHGTSIKLLCAQFGSDFGPDFAPR